jgi:ComF family protein
MAGAIARTFNQFFSVFLQTPCPLCDRATPNLFCGNCERQVRRCQLLEMQPLEPRTQLDSTLEVPVFAWGGYGGALKRAIAACKYHHQPHLAQPLGEWMAEAWQHSAWAGQRAIVVPIPMHQEKERQRGFNQANLLAQAFCRATQLPLAMQGLVRVRATEAQFGLSISARQRNLQDAFGLGRGLAGRVPHQPVLLLDDIYTTGATARSAIQTLRHQGIPVQGLIVLARTESENGRSQNKLN